MTNKYVFCKAGPSKSDHFRSWCFSFFFSSLITANRSWLSCCKGKCSDALVQSVWCHQAHKADALWIISPQMDGLANTEPTDQMTVVMLYPIICWSIHFSHTLLSLPSSSLKVVVFRHEDTHPAPALPFLGSMRCFSSAGWLDSLLQIEWYLQWSPCCSTSRAASPGGLDVRMIASLGRACPARRRPQGRLRTWPLCLCCCPHDPNPGKNS